LKPQDGKPVAVPTQDMVLGSYYLTLLVENEIGAGKVFASTDEALMAYDAAVIGLHAPIGVRVFKTIDGSKTSKIIKTTIGRVIFNENIPQDLGFVDRTNPDVAFDLEVDFLVDKKNLGKIVDASIKTHGTTVTAVLLDTLKALGFKFSTQGAITVSVSDMEIPGAKKELLELAEERVSQITNQFRSGFISDEERYNLVIETWAKTKDDVTKALMGHLDKSNPIFMMANSGARGSVAQITQLAGMRGLMADTSGRTMEIPVRANFREGLNVLEYFISTHGARKGLADTALRTADSGYLTRRLVDVSQDVIIRERDCGTDDGILVTDIRDNNEIIEELFDRLTGRYTAEDVIHPETGELLVAAHSLMLDAEAKKIIAAGVKQVKIRSVLSCKSKVGVCAKCYGSNLATTEEINAGEAVGIIAAQSIGEPGTQLTMRTFHTGGVAGDDITQGLPRVEELFEARKPKGLAIISEISGTVSFSENKKKREITVTNDEEGESKAYFIPFGSRIKVHEGDIIEPGDELTEGSIYPHDILKIKGPAAVQQYLIREVQRVYRLQGVDINDRHIEVIVRQMMRKVRIEDSGDTILLPGALMPLSQVEAVNKHTISEGREPAVWSFVIMGITKASLATDSFLSAASFQETTRVLTEAAINGRIDPLVGLKENVIIGKLMPAGTGMKRYNNIELDIDSYPAMN
jgi:DNA-directed RNA polymerase subunit beta'